jgi:hypothetical protein
VFIGHFALGLAAKRVSPGVSLGTMFMAAQWADLVWPVFVLSGVERLAIAPGATAFTPLDFVHYPYSHSLLALLLWGGLFAGAHALGRRGGPRSAIVLGALVLSHWVLDVITHRPDMPITVDGPTRLGLGLWNSVAGTVLVELGMLAAGAWLYTRATRPADRKGTVALVGLCCFLLVVNLANMLSPPPPSANAVAATALSMWLLVGWGYYIDRHRAPVRSAGSAA